MLAEPVKESVQKSARPNANTPRRHSLIGWSSWPGAARHKEAIINYYEHHIGDYAEATAHLSFVEDAAYSRLIRKYYASEKALPAEIKSVQRLIAARTRDEKEAVQTILEEFFELRDDGWHNTRCDEEISRFQEKRASAKRSADARWNRHKPHSEGNANASQDAMRTHSEGNAHQTPDTSHQSPDLKTHTIHTPTEGTQAGAVCARLRSEARMNDMNPANPKLLALIDAGLTADEIVAAGIEAKSKGKGFAYALAIAEGRRREAAAITPLPSASAQRPATGRQAAIDNYAVQAAAARGETHDRQPASERDITGESIRVA